MTRHYTTSRIICFLMLILYSITLQKAKNYFFFFQFSYRCVYFVSIFLCVYLGFHNINYEFFSWPLGCFWVSRWLHTCKAEKKHLKRSSGVLLASHAVTPLSYRPIIYSWCCLIAYRDSKSEIKSAFFLIFFSWLALSVCCCMQDLNHFKADKPMFLFTFIFKGLPYATSALQC